MQFSTVLAALASATSASAYITGISVPSTIVANETFALTLQSEVMNAKTVDVAVAYGFTTPPGNRGSIGQEWETLYIPSIPEAKGQKTFTVNVKAPEDLADYVKNGQVQVGAGIFSILGGVGNVRTVAFNVTVAVGDKVSETLVSSQGSVAY
ncbi:hypothetical protein yc1106_03646 [Curvularia clavata]|uniref:Uncharacterized protein n=1 Tax=Curvularia clavata TaxID=95742 RepID=A0A9Q9DR82_CURCL|nr:hypothetical protein yc1106_03646 [Curvularia clavata]